ncbi:hypothetical protein VTN00DRAFT_8574 [Thermoascus crustaceus]
MQYGIVYKDIYNFDKTGKTTDIKRL